MFETALKRAAALQTEALALADELEGLAGWLRKLGSDDPVAPDEPPALAAEEPQEAEAAKPRKKSGPKGTPGDYAESEGAKLTRQLVKRKGSQAKAAAVLGVGKTAISNWAQGQAKVPAKRLKQLQGELESGAVGKPHPWRRSFKAG